VLVITAREDERVFARLPVVECVARHAGAQVDHILRRFALGKAGGAASTSDLPAPEPDPVYGMVGQSMSMRAIFTRIDKAAAGDANVCIHGESGSGKELIARAIHQRSERRQGPFVAMDCTAIPEGLVESHLFGHVRGAFTGAIDHHEGLFALAHQGTLFVDELGELTLPLQAKLLRVLQTREFFQVGGSSARRTDTRIVVATTKDLARAVQQGTFREDLFYRVAVVVIRVPPLRERGADIPLLVTHFVRQYSRRHHKRVTGVTPTALARLVTLRWPGNVRQLEHLIEQGIVMAEGDLLTEADLFADDAPTWREDLAPVRSGVDLTMYEVERRHILQTLAMVRGNRTKAAALLEISVRGLQNKLKAYARESAVTPPLSRLSATRTIP
jgi:transcriptional regulator with PAS, ATPase and Fis domain